MPFASLHKKVINVCDILDFLNIMVLGLYMKTYSMTNYIFFINSTVVTNFCYRVFIMKLSIYIFLWCNQTSNCYCIKEKQFKT